MGRGKAEMNVPEASSEPKDQEEQGEGKHLACACFAHSSRIGVILQREDDEHQDCASDELAEDLACLGQEGLGICAEDASACRLAGWNGTDAVTFELVDGVDVVGVHHSGCTESTEELSQEVDGKSLPGEFAEEAEAECDCWIEETSGVTGHVDS